MSAAGWGSGPGALGFPLPQQGKHQGARTKLKNPLPLRVRKVRGRERAGRAGGKEEGKGEVTHPI